MNTKQFFGTEDVRFEFDVSAKQAMQKLDAQVYAPGNKSPDKQGIMVGGVSEDSTYVYRLVTGSRNSFRPTFYGYFSDAGSKSTLTGEITLNRVIKKFIIMWCSIVGLVAIFTLLTLLRNPAASWGSLIYVVVMLCLCIFFFHTMIKKSSSDKRWLKDEIERAIADS